MIPKYFLIPAACILFHLSLANAQPSNKVELPHNLFDASTEQTVSKIKTYLSKLEEVGFKGSVLVDINGDKVISSGYGSSNIALELKNSPQTIFDIGSITKQFTATAILKLEMQGKLTVDDKITKYFENVPADKQNITIHDLLRHQSGLISNVGKDYEKISKEDFINKVMESKLRFETGADFSYSNIGYSLLAMIIEKISGKTYETYLYENLWKPAKMELTGYTRPRFDSTLIAVGYDRYNKPWGKPTEKEWDKTAPYWHLTGNGGILSTTEDFYKWHNALKGENILNKSAKQKLYHPKIRSGEDSTSIYAYGWDVSTTARNTRQIWHNGTNRIFYSEYLEYPDENIFIITLSNKAHPDFNGTAREISRIIFEDKYRPEIPVEDNETNRRLTKHVIEQIEKGGLEEGLKTYNARDKTTNILEFEMRDAGFNFIDNNQPKVAIMVFELNSFAHPNSAKAIQGMGEGYMETGQKELAIINFKKSLLLNPDNRFVNDKLKELEKP